MEGAEYPTTVWSDQKNLTYIRSARRLSSRQARWASFLARFNFTLTYQPGSKNSKVDALSRLHSVEKNPVIPDTIVPTSQVTGVITTNVEAAVKRAQCTQPDPGTGPRTDCTYLMWPYPRSSSGAMPAGWLVIQESIAPSPLYPGDPVGPLWWQMSEGLSPPARCMPEASHPISLMLVSCIPFLS